MPNEDKPLDYNELLRKAAKEIREVALGDPGAVEEVSKDISKRGFNTKGIKCPWVWDVLIKHIPPINLRKFTTDIEKSPIDRGKYIDNEVSLRVVVQIVESDKVIAETESYGGHINRTRGDALKGATTNALKKALSYWGLGIETYKQTLDEDAILSAEGDEGKTVLDEELGHTPDEGGFFGLQFNEKRRHIFTLIRGACLILEQSKEDLWAECFTNKNTKKTYTKEDIFAWQPDANTHKWLNFMFTKIQGKLKEAGGYGYSLDSLQIEKQIETDGELF